MKDFKISYDEANDDLFMYSEGSKSEGAVEIGNIVLDFDKEKNLAAIQLINASEVLSKLIKKIIKIVRRSNRKMEEAKTSLWDSVDTTKELRPKIVFEFNFPVTVEFPMGFEKPVEYPSQYSEDGTGTYCVFDVIHEGDPAAIVTSAYSLLRGLKANSPLQGKKLKITKKMEKGKQQYVVETI
jgi:uncharacterized protein YuzE